MKPRIISLFCVVLFFITTPTLSQTTTFPAGSYIINMGVTPQTFANGLKPYGLVYDLLKNYKIPVAWVINSSKAKDGIDFSENGVNYRGGTFVIASTYRTPTVNAAISSWEAQGVIGATSTGALDLTVTKFLRFVPQWTLDKTNGSIAAAYFVNAGIPASAHGGSSSSGWKTPDQLGPCDDIFVMPHADPIWSTHKNLYYWNRDYKGNIWSACHAVSMLENISDSVTGIQMNFLSNTGLVPYTNHQNGSAPYSYLYPVDPFMQFMGTMDGATTNGSEQIFLPKIGGGWRPGAKTAVYDPTQVNVPALSPGNAAVTVYGRAYDDNTRGWVMYEAGHDHNSSSGVAEKVAAQRAFFNFSFFSNNEKNAWFDITIEGLAATIIPNRPTPLTFSVPVEVDMSKYTIQWSSSCGGTFSPNANAKDVEFTAPPSSNGQYCVITVTLTDACGRQVFSSQGSYPDILLSSNDIKLSGNYHSSSKKSSLLWSINDPVGINYFELEKSSNGKDYQSVVRLQAVPGLQEYHFTDPEITDQKNFYRVKSVSLQGNLKYSNVLYIGGQSVNKEIVSIFPNPAGQFDEIKINYTSSASDKILVTVFDIVGKKMMSETVKVFNGTTQFSISKNGFRAGVYILNIHSANNNNSVTERFMIR